MKSSCRIVLFVLPILAGLTGCESGGHFSLFGYSTQPTFNTDIRSVYVPIAKNETYLREIEFALTREVVNELGKSPYRVTSERNRADTELLMKVVQNRKSTVLLNQLGEARDVEIGINIEVVWRDLRPGSGGDILSNPIGMKLDELPLPGERKPAAPRAIPLLITPTANYIPELGGSNASARTHAARTAARQIVNMMEVWR
jgi:hypothetical protein